MPAGTTPPVLPVQEEAVQRWVQGLRLVEAVLREPGRPAPAPRQHLSLLHRQLVVALLRRLDTLLFRQAEGGRDRGSLAPPSARLAAHSDQVLQGLAHTTRAGKVPALHCPLIACVVACWSRPLQEAAGRRWRLFAAPAAASAEPQRARRL